jgi:hypothetical protein
MFTLAGDPNHYIAHFALAAWRDAKSLQPKLVWNAVIFSTELFIRHQALKQDGTPDGAPQEAYRAEARRLDLRARSSRRRDRVRAPARPRVGLPSAKPGRSDRDADRRADGAWGSAALQASAQARRPPVQADTSLSRRVIRRSQTLIDISTDRTPSASIEAGREGTLGWRQPARLQSWGLPLVPKTSPSSTTRSSRSRNPTSPTSSAFRGCRGVTAAWHTPGTPFKTPSPMRQSWGYSGGVEQRHQPFGG